MLRYMPRFDKDWLDWKGSLRMRLFRRPAVWAGIVAAIFALTIGGQPFATLPNDGGDDGVIEVAVAFDAAGALP